MRRTIRPNMIVFTLTIEEKSGGNFSFSYDGLGLPGSVTDAERRAGDLIYKRLSEAQHDILQWPEVESGTLREGGKDHPNHRPNIRK